jgi:pimeloyl-ACP methyl ester carboxylesterase
MIRKIWFVTIFLASLGLPACKPDNNREMDENVSIGIHSLHIRCLGQGRLTVVIDTGIGDSSDRWSDFQSQVSEFAHVCTYDRAGYGSSEPGPVPRHSQRLADELNKLLKNAGIGGPYVLVGHSLGGLNMQVYADRYPNKVAGLILIDPSPRPFICGQAFPELYQMLAEQTTEFQTMAEAARPSTDNEALAQASYLER